MRKMNLRLLALLCAVVMAFGLFGCAKTDEPAPEADPGAAGEPADGNKPAEDGSADDAQAGGSVDIEWRTDYLPISYAPGHPVVEGAMRAARAAGLSPRLASSGGGADANILVGAVSRRSRFQPAWPTTTPAMNTSPWTI